MGSTDAKLLGSDEGINSGISDMIFFFSILGNVYKTTLGIEVVTDLGYLYGSFDGSNYDKLEILFLGD